MALLDVLLIVLVGALALMGWRSGLIHESATLVGFALGLVVAGATYRQFGPLFLDWFSNHSMANLAAFVAVLLVTWVLVLLVGMILRETLQGMHLGWIDNMGGMALGAAKALFMAQILTLLLLSLPGERFQSAVHASLIGRQLAALAPRLVRLLPAVLRYW